MCLASYSVIISLRNVELHIGKLTHPHSALIIISALDTIIDIGIRVLKITIPIQQMRHFLKRCNFLITRADIRYR